MVWRWAQFEVKLIQLLKNCTPLIASCCNYSQRLNDLTEQAHLVLTAGLGSTLRKWSAVIFYNPQQHRGWLQSGNKFTKTRLRCWLNSHFEHHIYTVNSWCLRRREAAHSWTFSLLPTLFLFHTHAIQNAAVQPFMAGAQSYCTTEQNHRADAERLTQRGTPQRKKAGEKWGWYAINLCACVCVCTCYQYACSHLCVCVDCISTSQGHCRKLQGRNKN